MENEQIQTNESTIQENQTAEQPVAEQTEVVWKAPTEEEYHKAIQSEKSKAKYAILQELGITSVEEFKNKYNQVQEDLKSKEDLQNSLNNFKSENEHLKQEIIIKELNVSDNHKEDFLTLVRARMTDQKDFSAAATEVLENNPSWVKTNEHIKIGAEKSEVKPQGTNPLTKRYPWIK